MRPTIELGRRLSAAKDRWTADASSLRASSPGAPPFARGRLPRGTAPGIGSLASPRARSRTSGTLVSALRLGLRISLGYAAAQASLLAALETGGAIRDKLREDPPAGGFPWKEQPEVELESGAGKLKLYPYGERLYEAMLEEIEGAEERIFVGTFIWKDDEVGQRFVDALAKKAREGVEVYAVFDGLANVPVPRSFKRFPEPIHTLHFRLPWGPTKLVDPRNLLRYHRHVMSVDGRVAFLGGYNIGSLYATSWRDTHVRVRGGGAREVEAAYADFWNAHRWGDLPEIVLPHERYWDSTTRLHRNDPQIGIFPVRAVYLEAINRANHHVYLTHAYFVPDPALRAGLTGAARRGVDVQVLLPRRSNHAAVDWLARRHFDDMLRAGVRIFWYEDYMLHSKTATIDGLWSTVGSANIDHLSFRGLYEINLEVHSRRLARQMEEMFALDKTNTEEVTLTDWQKRPFRARIVERALDTLRPLV